VKPIVLTAEQRKEAERLRKKTLDRRIYQRLTAVLTVAAGHTPEDIAQLLVTVWEDFKQQGVGI
jgi:hypothetical protein